MRGRHRKEKPKLTRSKSVRTTRWILLLIAAVLQVTYWALMLHGGTSPTLGAGPWC